MKKVSLLAAALCLMLAACGPKAPKTETPQTEGTTAFSVNTVKHQEDREPTEEQLQAFASDWGYEDVDEIPLGNLDVEIDFPITNNATLKQSIEHFIAEICEEKEMMDSTTLLQNLKHEFEDAFNLRNSRSISVKCAEVNDNYITYTSLRTEDDSYADGFYEEKGATFKRETGKVFSWDMFNDHDALARLLYESIWGEEGSYPLDYYDVWVENGNVETYFADEPSGQKSRFSYDQIKDLLTDEGKAYFE